MGPGMHVRGADMHSCLFRLGAVQRTPRFRSAQGSRRRRRRHTMSSTTFRSSAEARDGCGVHFGSNSLRSCRSSPCRYVPPRVTRHMQGEGGPGMHVRQNGMHPCHAAYAPTWVRVCTYVGRVCTHVYLDLELSKTPRFRSAQGSRRRRHTMSTTFRSSPPS